MVCGFNIVKQGFVLIIKGNVAVFNIPAINTDLFLLKLKCTIFGPSCQLNLGFRIRMMV